MRVVVKVDREEIDVVKYYQKHGFKTLPPILTMSGAELYKASGNHNPTYQFYLWMRGAQPDFPVPSWMSIGLADGMEFYTVPHATSW